ncbi:GNAT family N-acetyltransferase [Photorhabdus luminescens]|uniref:N-acetyltransferase n=1 Tax=Photorhabdus luminescens subsp. sonorensis TaxID=1173677 RepID=A0A5C4RGI2_PHOLU|nr:GNAT family protein [Photorhabdus luminescens]TNH42944.1 N-acetyltransferase [Photorhabdus luminescens subsp. sonorensis]
MSWREKVSTILENEHVLLKPIHVKDKAEIRELSRDINIWRYFVFHVSNDDEFESFFTSMLNDQTSGIRAVYTVVDKPSGRIAGSMSFGNMVEKEARLEIGWSWLGEAFRGKGINRWAKYLLMQHSFEVLGALRVEFKTDVLNLQARAALRNIGATEEGILRSFNFMPSGRRRDAIFYSVLAEEWPEIKNTLQQHNKIVHQMEVE